MMNSLCVYKGETVIAGKVAHANTFFKRLFGLMPVKSLEEGCGILLDPCKQVHTYHMRFPIDVIFLSKDNRIIYIENEMKPNKITSYLKEANRILEVSGGTAELHGLKSGDIISFYAYNNA